MPQQRPEPQAGDPRSWLETVWAVLDTLNWLEFPEGVEDDTKTAMAWIAEALGIDPATV